MTEHNTPLTESPAGPLDATVAVAVEGYAWVDAPGTPPTARVLRRKVPREAGGSDRRYPLMATNPHLYRVFATLPLTEAAFQKFAEQWGVLGGGETFEAWQHTVVAMANVVEVVDLLLAQDTTGLLSLFRVDHSALLYERQTALGPVQQWFGLTNEQRVSLPHDADWVYFAAQTFVEGSLNLALRTTTAVQVREDEKTRLATYMTFTSLLGGLWLQCANAITRERVYRQCEGCGEWFVLSPGMGKRAQSKYCRENCRLKAYYQRRGKALRQQARQGGSQEEAGDSE